MEAGTAPQPDVSEQILQEEAYGKVLCFCMAWKSFSTDEIAACYPSVSHRHMKQALEQAERKEHLTRSGSNWISRHKD